MRPKRTQFMAPLVVVLGCGGPKREPVPGPARPPITTATPATDGPTEVTEQDPNAPLACYRGRCNPPAPPHRAYGTVSWVDRTTFIVVIDDDRREILERQPLRGVFMDNKGNDVPNSEVKLQGARAGLQGEWTNGPRPIWRRIRIFPAEER